MARAELLAILVVVGGCTIGNLNVGQGTDRAPGPSAEPSAAPSASTNGAPATIPSTPVPAPRDGGTDGSPDASGGLDGGAVDGGPDAGSADGGPADGGGVVCGGTEPKSCCLARTKYGGRVGADKSCGSSHTEDCCAYDAIPGGTFLRGNDAALPATLPSFKLGRYLVTAERFKVWMDEGGGLAANAPAEGAGAHPTLGYPATGWQPTFNGFLPTTPAELTSRVAGEPGVATACTLRQYPDAARMPMNCVDYYLMQAFCAWDGGYAITDAMWEYAARGGAEQRRYAWGSAPPNSLQQSNHCLEGAATWNVDLLCTNPATQSLLPVDFSVDGRGKWGTFDLMGNLVNMTIDEQGAAPLPCTNDCVSRPSPAPNRAVVRGTAYPYPNFGWQPPEYEDFMTKRNLSFRKNFNSSVAGFRCGYPSDWSAR